MSTISTMLSDLADRLEHFTPMPVPEGDDPKCWSLDLQLTGACCNDSAIHDALQLYESVEFASSFKERCDHLYKLAKSDDPNAMASLARMISNHARYCRSLAEAIEAKYRANPPGWDVPKMLEGRQSAAGKQPTRNDTDDEWPPSDHVAVSTIMHVAEYKKDDRNPKRTTIQGWEKRESVTKEYHPQSNEVAYPQEWVSRHWNKWSPRQPKRNTPT